MSNEDRESLFFAQESDIDLEQNIIGTYSIRSSRFSTKESAEQIAMEESIGTWTDITTETVAYPLELFDPETGGIPNLLSIVAGNLFGLTGLDRVKLLDIDLPKQYVQSYPGPRFGIEGIRQLVGTLKNRRPHVGTIIKPKVGLTPTDTAKVAYEAASGGLDLIKDDETLTSQKF
jgi:ribulose-bisphosphate carboxylase large chain